MKKGKLLATALVTVMRALLIVTFFTALSCRAEDTPEITSKVSEKKDSEGKATSRIEMVFRGKTKVMMIISDRNAQGALVVTSRGYLVGGSLIMTESDANSDGVFERLTIYDTNKHDMEVFSRQHDGSMRPVDTHTLQACKTQIAAISQFWDKAFEKDMDGYKMRELLQETRKKIQDAEKRKTDDKK